MKTDTVLRLGASMQRPSAYKLGKPRKAPLSRPQTAHVAGESINEKLAR